MNHLGFDYLDANRTILNPNNINGRIDLVTPPSPEIAFQMQERIAVKNNATEYRNALSGIWESNILSDLFFSEKNVQTIQNGLRAGVYKMSNSEFVIGPQNIDTLKVIMRSIYLQYAQHAINNVTAEIEKLNKLVWDYAVPSVYNEAVGYMKYCLDQSTIVQPLALPRHVDRVYKQLELKHWV
jgi:hypothetical protein